MAASSDYDAILQEVKPPDLGGYECYRRLRSASPRALVAMTTGFGYDTAHSILKARADGMKHVLYKPFRQDQILKLLPDLPPLLTPTPLSSAPPASTEIDTPPASQVPPATETSLTAPSALPTPNPSHLPSASSAEPQPSPTVAAPPN